jgi:hypothetical protein
LKRIKQEDEENKLELLGAGKEDRIIGAALENYINTSFAGAGLKCYTLVKTINDPETNDNSSWWMCFVHVVKQQKRKACKRVIIDDQSFRYKCHIIFKPYGFKDMD